MVVSPPPMLRPARTLAASCATAAGLVAALIGCHVVLVYGASAETLSLRATMPRFLEAERLHGSVTRGLRAAARATAGQAAHGARYGLFINFDHGIQVLTDALAASLGDALALGVGVRALHRASRGFDYTSLRERNLS